VILIVHPDVPAHDLQELIALARKSDLSFASGGIGASTHLVGVMVNLRAGIKVLHVPFKGSGPALNALLGGHVTMDYGGISSAAPYVKAGKVRAIAVTGSHRDPSLPDVPTFTEAGLADADVTSVWGLHAPAGTPIALRRTIRDVIAEVVRDPETAKRLVEYGYEPIANTPEEHQAQTAALVNKWIEIGKTVNLKE
jgi:tripartite-type tricarboxylate transporter receptor subunit TctC